MDLFDGSTCLSEEHPASHSASRESERDWMIRVATSPSNTYELLAICAPGGLSGKTSPAFCRMTEEGLLESSSGSWGNSGMGSPTAFLTLSSSEFPSDADVCSLSDVLETGDVPQRFYLSPKACAGILRRAAKRGKTLPEPLALALRAAAADLALEPMKPARDT